MSQNSYKNSKIILIDFKMEEDFTSLLKEECLALTLITNGKAVLKINDKNIVLTAPCIFLSSLYDRIVLLENNGLAAKSLRFHPTFINKSLSFKNLLNNDFNEIADEHDSNLLSPFLTRNEFCDGIIKPLHQTYLRISEWFDLADSEYKIKSDGHQLHRVRRNLLQILFILEDIYINKSNDLPDESVIDIVLEYIHTNFSKEISLGSLCKLVYMNRTSLNRKFKTQTGRSPIDYLLHHRLGIACELLTNSKLSINKIAETTGFKNENYFSRQFSAKIGMTPSQYRQSDGFETFTMEESRIVDEF